MKVVQDEYFKKAKQDGYVARSAYKLEEIQKKHHILKAGQQVIDLGCFPGSWVQYTAKIVGNKGMVLGIDRTEMVMPAGPNMKFVQGDLYELDLNTPGEFAKDFDVVLSDMAPDTSGNRVVDSERSFQLCELAMITAARWLKKDGTLVLKSLQGPAYDRLIQAMRLEYKKVKIQKPKSSRAESKEVFVIGLEKKEEPTYKVEN